MYKTVHVYKEIKYLRGPPGIIVTDQSARKH